MYFRYTIFLRGKGVLASDKRGRYDRTSLLDFEDISKKATEWLRQKVHDIRFSQLIT